MSPRALRLASPSLVDHLAAGTIDVLRVWSLRWGLALPSDAVRAGSWDVGGRPQIEAGGQWQDAGARGGTVFWPDALERSVTEALYPRSPEEPTAGPESLARAGGRRALADLRRMLSTQWFGTEALTEPGAWCLSRWDAPVRLDLQIGPAACITVIVAAARLPNEPRAPAKRLTPVDPSAFRDIAVTAEVVIGRAEVALPDALALQVNDVIVLDARLGDALELRVGGTDLSLQGSLGRVADRRALQIVSPHPRSGVSS